MINAHCELISRDEAKVSLCFLGPAAENDKP